MAESSYVGNRGTRLGVNRNINATAAATSEHEPDSRPGPVGIDHLPRSLVPEPVLRTGSPVHQHHHYAGTDAAAVSALRRVTFNDPVGYSWFHSLQSRLEKRMSQGFTVQVSYTWSKAMDATAFLNAADPMPYESLADIDRAHRIVGSGI